MAQARQVVRGLPNATIYFAAAVAAALVIAASVAIAMLSPFQVQAPTRESHVTPAVMEAARQWELQRQAQSGYVDPLIEAGREWQRQREQQSGSSD